MGIQILFLLVLCGLAHAKPKEFTHSTKLNAKYSLSWKFNDTHITFQVKVKTTGYIGFGITRDGGAINADMVFGGVYENGTVYIKDYNGGASGVPFQDSQQDVDLISGTESNEHTTLTFSRLLDTCDQDDYPVDAHTTKVIWAYHPDDAESGTEVSYNDAEHKGEVTMRLLMQSTKKITIPHDADTIEILNPDIAVPSTGGSWCQIVKLPESSSQKQMIKHEAVINSKNEPFISYLVLYPCEVELDDVFDGHGYLCNDYDESVRTGAINCYGTQLALWAAGEKEFFLPEEVGATVLRPNKPWSYVVLNTGFSNPGNEPTAWDNSGFRLTVTATLRESEMGILAVGSEGKVVPPNFESFESRHFCPSECTTKNIPNDGISVFAAFVHAGKLAVSYQTYHGHQDEQGDDTFGRDDRLDPNYLTYRTLREHVEVTQGDFLGVECVYNTTGIYNIIQNKACIVYLMYYPKINGYSYCPDGINITDLMKITPEVVLDEDFNVVQPAEYAGLRWDEVLNQKVDWTNQTIRQNYQELVLNSNRTVNCNSPDWPEERDVDYNPPDVTPVEDVSTCLK